MDRYRCGVGRTRHRWQVIDMRSMPQTSRAVDRIWLVALLMGLAAVPPATALAAAGVTVDKGDGVAVREGGAYDTYTIRLAEAPTAEVIVTATPADGQIRLGAPVAEPEPAGAAYSVTFGVADWDTPKVVAVHAVDDTVVQGTRSVTVTHIVTSDDASYNDLAVASVSVTVLDNDVSYTLEAGQPTVPEGNSGSSTPIGFAIARGGALDLVSTVDYALNGAATSGVDYTGVTVSGTGISVEGQTITFGVGVVTATIGMNVVGDDVDEADETIVTTLSNPTVPAPGTATIQPPDTATTTIQDDDTRGIVIATGDGVAVTENGASDTYTVALQSQPTADVTVTLTPGDAQILVSPATLPFTTLNWATAQTVTVTAVDDDVAEGVHTSSVQHTASGGDYQGLVGPTVEVTINDNDTAGVLVDASGLAGGLVEGASGTYSMVLTSQPTGTVTITATPSNAQIALDGGAPGQAAQVSFGPDDWQTPKNVSVLAVDDDVAEGPHGSTIDHTASSTDPLYNGISVSSVTLSITDNDTVGLVFVESDGTTVLWEGGASDAYTVALQSQPTADVTVMLTPGDAQILVSPTTLPFTTLNWATAQTVTVTAVDDEVAEGVHTSSVQHTASGGDYEGLVGPTVQVTIEDNDYAGVLVQPSSVTVQEPDDTEIFAVRLTSRPTSSVTIDLQVMDSRCTVAPDAVTLHAGNWQTGVNVTVTAVDDDVADGDQTVSIVTLPARSADPFYDGLNPPDVVVTVLDDDVPGIQVWPLSLNVAEGGDSAAYTMRLASEPTAAVTVAISTDEQVVVSPTQLVFTAANWRLAQSSVVTAVDDDVAEGDHGSIIRHTVSSVDPVYAALTVSDVSVAIVDDDATMVALSASRLDVMEGGGGAEYDVVLTTRPSAEVTIEVRPADDQLDVGAGPGEPITLTFPPEDWNVPQAVFVMATDDEVVEGYHTSIIVHVARGGDYEGVPVGGMLVRIQDNDHAGISATPAHIGIVEGGASEELTVRLTSQPTAPVLLGISVEPDDGHCRTDVTSVTLDATNWANGARVRVTAVDNDLRDGTRVRTLILGPVASVDLFYDGLALGLVGAVEVTIYDDEPPGWVTVPLVMGGWPPIPEAPVLRSIDNADGDDTFRVSWGAAVRAASYVLEEARQASYADAIVVYRGTATNVTLDGRGPGRYYYRVRAVNAYGQSAWSAGRSVDVTHEVEPNDGVTEANGPLVSGVTYYGWANGPSDAKDYYVVELTGNHRIELWLCGMPAGHNADLVLRDERLYVVGYSGKVGSEDEHILSRPLSPGRYYIQVYHRTYGGSDAPYTLRYVVR